MPGLVLADGQVDLWYVFLEMATDPALLASYWGLLSDDEQRRQQRFVVESPRHQFLVARALLRTVLSKYGDCEPRQWGFETNAYGKPAIVQPAGCALRFNLSHTHGLAVCAVTLGREVGVDVEWLGRRHDNRLDLARRFFAAADVAAMEQCPVQHRDELFVELWTLKEAYVKARGKGLSIPLSSFALTLRADRPAELRVCGETGTGAWDIARAWQFAQLRLAGEYQVALAVEMP